MATRSTAALAVGALVASGSLLIAPAAAAPTSSSQEPAGQGRPGVEGAEISDAAMLEVKFSEALEVRGEGSQLRSLRGRSLNRVAAVLDRHGADPPEPLVPGMTSGEMNALVARAEERSGRPVPDVASWYSITLPAGADAEAAAQQLRALPEVEYAYPAPEPVPPPRRASRTPDFTSMQGYFGPADQNGINADFSRQDPRIRGDGIKIVDLEYNWYPFHEDLQLDWSTDLGGDVFPRYDGFGDHHGTAVFGELVAVDNRYGVTGGVPDAEIYGISPTQRLQSGGTAWRPGPALFYLAGLDGGEFLQPGDAVLLEQQTVGPNGGDNYAPLEWIPSVFEAIQLLTSMGVTVVETGGNGDQNVDGDEYTRNGVKWFDPDVQHSGAILVGAGHSVTQDRLGFSNYGERFDLQGWGHNITTTGYGSLWPEDELTEDNYGTAYTDSFGGTSGAGPIVTSAVVAVQSYVTSTGQEPWSATEIADLLKATGTPQGSATADDEHIGPLPDLKAALTSIEVDAPETTLLLNGRRQRPGSYVNPVITLEADDDWGSGVDRTEYRIDDGEWITYDGGFQVVRQGVRTVYYRSVDENGNVEDVTATTFMNRGRGRGRPWD